MIQIKPQVSTNLRPTPTTDNLPIRSFTAGTILSGAQWVIIPADVYKNGTLIQKAGDKWLKVDSPEPGYMAVIHKGSTAGLPRILQDDSTPPNPSERTIISAIITYSDGTTERLV